MALDFRTSHVLQERLPLVLLVLKICSRSIPELFYTSAILYSAEAHCSVQKLNFCRYQIYPCISHLLSEDNQVPYLLDTITRTLTCSFLSQGIIYHVNVTWTNLYNPASKNNAQKKRRQATIEVAPKKSPQPRLISLMQPKLSAWPLSRTGQQRRISRFM